MLAGQEAGIDAWFLCGRFARACYCRETLWHEPASPSYFGRHIVGDRFSSRLPIDIFRIENVIDYTPGPSLPRHGARDLEVVGEDDAQLAALCRRVRME